MIHKNILTSFIISFFSICLCSQNEYGIKLNTLEAFESYTLFEASNGTYLVNNCGELVHSWPNAKRANHHPKLMENGNLIFIYNSHVEQIDWDGNVTTSANHNDASLILNYEVIILSNGNYLCLARRIRPRQYFTELGITDGSPEWDDTVVEINPSSGEIVWEWNITDHTIQDQFSSLKNYGVLSDNPQLLNTQAISTFDWTSSETFMINGMDYNEELDQIVLSVRKINEIIIIDHSTTTSEAKGSTGGNSGKGGDVLYRFGNPQNYGQGVSTDQIFYYQHNPNWIEYGEHKGKIIVHNNGLNRPGTTFSNRYSSVDIIEPLTDNNGSYLIANGSFLPLVPDLSYNRHTTNTFFYSGYTSSAKVLPNGHIYITEGANDRFFEINSEGESVWEYQNQFGSYIFRSEKYALDYPAFIGRDLSPNGTLEIPSSTYDCTLVTSNTLELENDNFDINVIFENGHLIIQSDAGMPFKADVHDISGHLLLSDHTLISFHELAIGTTTPGLYLITILNKNDLLILTKKIFIP